MRVFVLTILLAVFGFTQAPAQTITIGEVTNLHNCVNDDIVITYKASGTFESDNQFFVQLSDANGSFQSWTNSTQRSSRDSDKILMHLGSTGSHFRVRVASTNPFTTSNDNGKDIEVISYPNQNTTIHSSHLVYKAFNGDTIQFSDKKTWDSRVKCHNDK